MSQPTQSHTTSSEQKQTWILTRVSESSAGLHQLTLLPKYIGNPKDEIRILQAQSHVHDFCLLGKNPHSYPPDILQNGLKLYEYLFPNPNEREDSNEIIERLGHQGMRRSEKGCFDVIIGRDANGRVISWHQFSTIPLPNDDGSLAFMQYTGSADASFMKTFHDSKVGYQGYGIYSLNTALMLQIAEENTKVVLQKPGGVKGYILETEFLGQGKTDQEILFTEKRLKIHEMTGAKALILRMKDGSLFSPHYQPALGKDAHPIKLLLLFRRTYYDTSTIHETKELSKDEAKNLLMAFLENFDVEGFDQKHVEDVRKLMNKWLLDAESAVLFPPSQVPNILMMSKHDDLLREQVEREYWSVVQHEKSV